MSVRLRMTAAAWAQVASALDGLQSPAGNPPELSDRLCSEAGLYSSRWLMTLSSRNDARRATVFSVVSSSCGGSRRVVTN